MRPRIPQGQGGPHEQVHQTFLLVLFRWVGQIIERENGVVGREDSGHEAGTIEIVPTGSFLHVIDESDRCVQNRLTIVAVSVEIDAYGSNPRMEIEALER